AEPDRALYHSAIAHASNHTVAILAQSMEVLSSLGVEDPSRVLASLVDARVSNVLPPGPRAPTGAVRRGAVTTVAAHGETPWRVALSQGTAEVADAYRAMARATTARALENGTIDEPTAARMLDTLGD